jgi:hypothetical protein
VFLGSRGHPVHKTDNLTTICKPVVQNMWESYTACYRDNFTSFLQLTGVQSGSMRSVVVKAVCYNPGWGPYEVNEFVQFT